MCISEIEYFTEDSIVCDNGVLGPADSLCKMHFDVYGDIVGCRDLSHLEQCGKYLTHSHTMTPFDTPGKLAF